MSDKKRKLVAIVFTDIAGFSELSASDENRAMELVNIQRELIQPIIDSYDGTLHKEIGDGFLLTFPTVTAAVEFGIDFQRAIKHHDELKVRIGIHEGEVTVQENDVFGDDVNVSARIEPYSPVGGIAISEKVKLEIGSLPEYQTEYIGEPELKGISQPIKIYCISSHGLPFPKKSAREGSVSEERKGFNFNILSITGILLTIVGFAFWAWYGLAGVTRGSDIDLNLGIKKSIAILHFENLTGNNDDDFFCSALTEQVRGSLSKLTRLDVASRLISKKLKSKSVDTNNKVYGDLDYYVEGTLSRAADNRNINISLINAKNHKVKWSQRYTFTENEIVQYKDTILNNIALNLNIDYEPVQLISQKGASKNSDEFKLLGRGLFDFEHNNFSAALSSFNSILDLHSNNVEAMFHKANTLVKLNRADEAINIYNNLLSLSKQHNHFGSEWVLQKREGVESTMYAEFNAF